jgi:hypothetical protein
VKRVSITLIRHIDEKNQGDLGHMSQKLKDKLQMLWYTVQRIKKGADAVALTASSKVPQKLHCLPCLLVRCEATSLPAKMALESPALW